MARAIIFDLNDKDLTIDFGTYALIMYYAKQLNQSKAMKLFDATSTEYRFRIRYKLPTAGLTDDDYDAHFISSEIMESFMFIDNELIPNLNSETEDLLKKYGGKSGFLAKYYNSPGFLSALGLEEDEFYNDSPQDIIHYLMLLKEFMQYAIGENKAYQVYVH